MPDLPASLDHLRRHQDGVLSRAQLLALGHEAHDVRRWRRQRLLSVVHEGVYVDHMGPVTWLERAWAAVLHAAPAALYGPSALRAVHGPGWRGHPDTGPVHVVIDVGRTVVAPPGVRVHRTRGFDLRVQAHTRPPRVRVEEAVLDVAAAAPDDLAAVAVLCAAVGAHLTTADRLEGVLSARSRIARRAMLAGTLNDVRAGACSVLEVAYLRDVERAHGLPRGRRQAPRVDRPGLRDVLYETYGCVVELDGRLDHTLLPDRDRDLDRDLDALAVSDLTTVRLGWGQVVGRACRTAAAVAELLQRHGWPGDVRLCPRCAASCGPRVTG